MEDAELYQKNNSVQRKDAIECLEKWKNIPWGSKASVIDIGCGDGSVTDTILKKYLPSDFKKLIGSDINEKVLKFAKENYKDERVEFLHLDIESDLPEQLKGRFDHVFSNYALHWIKDIKKSYRNIYSLLKDGGRCLLIILGSHISFDAFRIIAKTEKWKNYIQDVENIISYYHDSQSPEDDILDMLTQIGFKDIDVKCEKKLCIYEKAKDFMNFLKSANFYQIPSDVYDDYLEDLLGVYREMNLTDGQDQDDETSLTFDYNLIVINASK